MESEQRSEEVSGSATTTAPKVVPAWYAEMTDPDYWLEQCKLRAQLLAMLHGRTR